MIAAPPPEPSLELVPVDQVSTARYAPVEFIGRLRRVAGGLYVNMSSVVVGDQLLARPSPDAPWRTGRATVEADREVQWHWIVAICEGDYVYRIGKPTTPSLEERVAMLERLVHPDLIVADDAEKSGRPAIAAELRAKFPWWRDPGGDR